MTEAAKKARAEVSPALDAANDDFHETYDRAEKSARDDAPVFVLLGDLLYFRRSGKSTHSTVVPVDAHRIKSAVHVAVAAWTALLPFTHRHDDARLEETIAALHDHASASEREVAGDEELATMLADARAFLEACRRERRVGAEALDAFAKRIGERVDSLMERAAAIELDRLHAAVEASLRQLDADELDELHVVVAGVHQARDRSLGMQYFAKRLRDRPGAAHRVLYAENAGTLEEALAVVGKHRIDRKMARAFFGDPARMQRDLLGDAAEHILAERDVGTIGRER